MTNHPRFLKVPVAYVLFMATLFAYTTSFAQNKSVTYTSLPTVGDYNHHYSQSDAEPKVHVSKNQDKIIIKTDKDNLNFLRTDIGCFIPENMGYEDLHYLMKFRFLEGGKYSACGVSFRLDGKSCSYCDSIKYVLVFKRGRSVASSWRMPSAKAIGWESEVNKDEENTLEIFKTGNNWKYLVNGVVIHCDTDAAPNKLLLVHGSGGLVLGKHQGVEIVSVNQEYSNGRTVAKKIEIAAPKEIIKAPSIPRDLSYYHGKYKMVSDCSFIGNIEIDVTQASFYTKTIDLNGLGKYRIQLELREEKPNIYSCKQTTKRASDNIYRFSPDAAYGIVIYIDEKRFFLRDLVLEYGKIKFNLYYEEAAKDQLNYGTGRLDKYYKSIDCNYIND